MKEAHVDAIAAWVFPICIFGLLVAPAIWAYQIYHWLRWGAWLPIPVEDALALLGGGPPQFAWAGVQKVSDWVMTAPVSLAIPALLIAILVAFTTWADAQPKDKAALPPHS